MKASAGHVNDTSTSKTDTINPEAASAPASFFKDNRPEALQLKEMMSMVRNSSQSLPINEDVNDQSQPPIIQRKVNNCSTLEEWKAGNATLVSAYDALSPMQKGVFNYLLKDDPQDHKATTAEETQKLIDDTTVNYFAGLYANSRYFQGTRTSNVASILKTGLDPAHGGGDHGASATRDNNDGERDAAIAESKGYVHLGTNKGIASDYVKILENPKAEDVAAAPGSVLRVFLDRDQRATLSVDISSNDARKTPRLIPARQVLPVSADLADEKSGHRSTDAMMKSILSFDDKKLISPDMAPAVAKAALLERRISFAGYDSKQHDDLPADAKEANQYKDVENNAQPLTPHHLALVREMADRTPRSLLEDVLQSLSHSPIILEWIYDRLTDVQQEKLKRVLAGDKTDMSQAAKDRLSEVIPPPWIGPPGSAWENSVVLPDEDNFDDGDDD
jgi:hypothetical protein